MEGIKGSHTNPEWEDVTVTKDSYPLKTLSQDFFSWNNSRPNGCNFR